MFLDEKKKLKGQPAISIPPLPKVLGIPIMKENRAQEGLRGSIDGRGQGFGADPPTRLSRQGPRKDRKGKALPGWTLSSSLIWSDTLSLAADRVSVPV